MYIYNIKGVITMVQVLKASARKLPEGMQVDTGARGFKILLDEPEDLGGTDKGMNPVEAVLGALGACQTIVAFAFAEAKGIDLQEFEVDVEGDLDTDGFLGLSDVRPGCSEIRFNIHVKSSNSEEEIAEFIDFVEKTCPVGDMLENGVKLVRSNIIVEN